ncbi:MAG: FtsX-like permease family protein [Planctomycetia bacterium]|nr:FtsX-like permease family protein [Planctomycetia bacterium]
MSTLRMLLAEIRYRRLNFLLSLFAVTIAATLFVAGPVLVDGYARQTRVVMDESKQETADDLARLEDRTRVLMRDIGFNLMIVHRDTNMSDFWAADYAASDMPQEYIDRLARDRRLTIVTHLVATLQQKITFNDRKVLLIGYLPEATQSHLRHKDTMGYAIEPGKVILGYELGVGKKPGDTVDVLGRKFTVAEVLPEKGSKEDITLDMHLSDAQAVLNKPGRINEILALGCRCPGPSLPIIREQLAAVLPETRITEFNSIAVARAEQRSLVAAKQEKILADLAASRLQVQDTLESLAGVITPVVVLACAVWVGLLALLNVRERRTEIGVLRAIGKPSGRIAALFLGKAVLLGLGGAAIGFVLGSAVAQLLGTRALGVSSDLFTVHYGVLLGVVFGAPLLAALASYLPTLIALMQDPAVVLRDL